jgi:hypothetical protein
METGGAACDERRWSVSTADRFREIDTQVSEVRRALDNGGDYHTIRGHLVALQLTAQNGLREALADEPKLAAYDELLTYAQKIADCEHDDACEFLADEAEGCTCHVGEAKALAIMAKK